MTTTIRPESGAVPAAARHSSPPPATVHAARRALAAAAALGVAGDVLLREGPSGIGFPIFVAALLCALAWLTGARRMPWTLGACLLVAPALYFSIAFAWRASDALALLNLLALVAALTALSTALLRGEDWEPAAGIGDYVAGAGRTAREVAGGTGLLLLRDGNVRELRTQGRARRAGALARGAVIALPLLVVFGSLLTAADPVFDRLVRRVLYFDLDAVVSHVAVASCFAWLAGGYLRSAVLAPDAAASRPAARARLSLGLVEVAVVLGLLDVLFLGFVLVQIRYLFGGAAHVVTTAGMTYADYARAGFFELVWVAVLALPTLLSANGLLRRDGARDERVFRVLAGALLVLLGVVMLSAMQRMRLYQREYGLTETRLYASAAMGWLALVFAWFAATVLRGRAAPFAFGALVSAWVVVAALDVVNPDALIARTNVARLEGGQRFDPAYVASLSADATPELVAALPSIEGGRNCAVGRALLRRLEPERSWTAWNLGRARARRAVEGQAGRLRGLVCAR